MHWLVNCWCEEFVILLAYNCEGLLLLGLSAHLLKLLLEIVLSQVLYHVCLSEEVFGAESTTILPLTAILAGAVTYLTILLLLLDPVENLIFVELDQSAAVRHFTLHWLWDLER